jgi:hypothetical protein
MCLVFISSPLWLSWASTIFGIHKLVICINYDLNTICVSLSKNLFASDLDNSP